MNEETIDRLSQIEDEIEAKMRERREILQGSTGEVVDDYTFHAPDGTEVTLRELFGDRDELLVVHNMGKSCRYCTLWADGFNGVADHLSDRAAFALISPDSPSDQKEFAESRGWRFPTYSAAGTSFIGDMDYQTENDEGKIFYMPGYSVFRKEPDGTLRRTGRDFFGPMDMYSGIWHMFSMLPEGVNGWQPRFEYEKSGV